MMSHSSEEPFAFSGLNAVLATAAENSPDHILLEDDRVRLSAAQVLRRARQLAVHLHLGGLRRGERVLIVAGAQAETLVAITAVLRAGLEPVLAPCNLNPVELGTCAMAADAAVLIGPSGYGSLDLADVYLSAAAIAESVRGILTHGPDVVDGAVDVSFDALDASPAPDGDGSEIAEMPTIVTLAGPKLAPRLISHRQAALFADALSLVEQARINPSQPLMSLLPPASLAGLVAGPFAAFVGASRLVLHGPFATPGFLSHCAAGRRTDRPDGSDRGAHLVAPAEIGRVFDGEPFAADLASLILVSRFEDHDAFSLPSSVAFPKPVVDLYTFGEEGVLAQTRQNGIAGSPRRAADLSVTDGLGARLNRARAEQRFHRAEPMR